MNKTAKTLGVSFLAASQGQHGGYLSHSSSDPSTFKDTSTYSTTFASALILDCLHNCPHTENIKQKLVSFLLSQKTPSGSFNYWDRNDPITQTLPYPDDLDDTFCALAALHRANKKGTNGKTLAQAVTLLALTEIKEGGPYKTWLVPDNAAAVWHDVDPAVNSNIAYFLSLQEVELVSLVELTENAIQSANYTSPYYPNEYPLFYFISRWYRGRLLTSLADAILSRQLSDGSWGSPLKTALALTSLLRLTLPVPKIHQAVSFLCKTQNSDGSWEAEGFCYDPMIQG
ncbi:MAG TPA: prenyltransferase/squalene oxidase repeat-containing protein, partial [Patescibacteria group bacterium]